MTDWTLLIERHGFGLRTSPCGFGAGPRESKGLPRQPVLMVPGGGNARYLGQQPVDMDPRNLAVGYGDLKLDGIRAHYIDGRIVSREGTPIDCARHCLEGLKRVEARYGHKMVFDGEYLEPGGFEATNSAFKRGEGAGVLWLFDAVPFAEWVRNQCTQILDERRVRLMLAAPFAGSENIGVLRHRPVFSYAETRNLYVDARRIGAEGIVVKDAEGRYQRNPSGDWQRLKETATFDCPIIDVLEHPSATSRRARVMVKGPFGPLIIAIKGAAVDTMIGRVNEDRVVEIAFNQKAGEDKPRHARFVRFRDDKEASHHA